MKMEKRAAPGEGAFLLALPKIHTDLHTGLCVLVSYKVHLENDTPYLLHTSSAYSLAITLTLIAVTVRLSSRP